MGLVNEDNAVDIATLPTLTTSDCSMQVRMSEYNQLKGQVTAANRKQTGSLAVRDLTGLVSEDDAVNTENLLTLFTVVSKHDKNEWLTTYETLSDFVVSFTDPAAHMEYCLLCQSLCPHTRPGSHNRPNTLSSQCIVCHLLKPCIPLPCCMCALCLLSAVQI